MNTKHIVKIMNLNRLNHLIFIIITFTLFFVNGSSCKNTHPISNIERQINQYLCNIYTNNEPGGAVIAVLNQEIVFKKGYGIANMEMKIPIKPDMVFQIASITKQFTAVAIMMLSDQGILDIDKDFRTYLPDFPIKRYPITIKHLLTHTSGIADFSDIKPSPLREEKDYTVQEVIDVFKNLPLNYKPGEKVYYNNSGYFLLGAIIEKVSGKPYGNFIEEEIFFPLGMKNSYYGNNSKIIPRRVRGYYKNKDGEYKNANYISWTIPFAAGALMSTVEDMAKWDAALYTNKLISKKSLYYLFTPVLLNNNTPTVYSPGGQVTKFCNLKMINHSGGCSGFRSFNIRIPEKGLYIAVLSNNRSAVEYPAVISKNIARILLKGHPFPQRITNNKTSSTELNRYAGIFRISKNSIRRVIVEGDRIYMKKDEQDKKEIFLAGENTFKLFYWMDYIVFEENKQGDITALVYHSETGEITREIKVDYTNK